MLQRGEKKSRLLQLEKSSEKEPPSVKQNIVLSSSLNLKSAHAPSDILCDPLEGLNPRFETPAPLSESIAPPQTQK